MTPLFRTSQMEWSANLLAKHFRQVLVDAAYYCRPSIRIRADRLIQNRVYFDRTQSQITLWQNNGGILLRWDRRRDPGEYEAILYSECPRSIEFLDRYAQGARWLVVVYEPREWRVHFENIRKRNVAKPPKRLRSAVEGLERVKQLVESAERFTSHSLARLLLAHQGQIAPPSSSLVSPAGAARAAGTAFAAP